MSGRPGTPHFGVPENPQNSTYVQLPDGEKYQKMHFQFDPSQAALPMNPDGSRPSVPVCYTPRERMVDYMANHDGLTGGDSHVHNMDEQKVLQNRVYSVKVEYSSLEGDIRSREPHA